MNDSLKSVSVHWESVDVRESGVSHRILRNRILGTSYRAISGGNSGTFGKGCFAGQT